MYFCLTAVTVVSVVEN